MITPRVALYLRVSTRDQSYASQEQALREYCARRGWKNLAVYREKKSGASDSRPVLGRLMEAVRGGAVDVVAVYKLDRFGRSVAHMTHLLQELKTRKVGFVCSSQQIDTTEENPVGDMVIHILIAVAGFERTLAIERSKAGVAAARRAGVTLGRPRMSDAKIDAAHALRKKFPDMQKQEIARRVGLSPAYLTRLFNGERKCVARHDLASCQTPPPENAARARR